MSGKRGRHSDTKLGRGRSSSLGDEERQELRGPVSPGKRDSSSLRFSFQAQDEEGPQHQRPRGHDDENIPHFVVPDEGKEELFTPEAPIRPKQKSQSQATDSRQVQQNVYDEDWTTAYECLPSVAKIGQDSLDPQRQWLPKVKVYNKKLYKEEFFVCSGGLNRRSWVYNIGPQVNCVYGVWLVIGAIV